MMNRVVNTVLALALSGACALGQDHGQSPTVASVSDVPADNAPSTTSLRPRFESRDRSPVAIDQSSPYYWKTTPVGDSAQLLTLFCRACGVSRDTEEDVPLISVLRDTLGDQSGENDRVTYLWLLTRAHPRIGQRILSAIPFFYWRISKGSKAVSKHDTVPFMDLGAPENPMMARVGQDLLQWTAFDPMMTPVRASTHAYGTNGQEDERLHIEEAISYLRQAPVSNDSTALTQVQLDTAIGKLKLHETLLGGLGTDNQAARLGMQSEFEQERIRSRNGELLREWAEKTGLIFEPLNLNGNRAHYGILWFPQSESAESENLSLQSIWKLLAIRNPWTDERLKNWKGPVYEHAFDKNSTVGVIPLAVYSLDYPKQPLILMDFRHKLSRRRREVAQRSVNELITLRELARPELQPQVRKGVAAYLRETIDRHREQWTKTADDLDEELAALKQQIEFRKQIGAEQPKKWTPEQIAAGDDKEGRRLRDQLHGWEREYTSYVVYVSHVRALLALNPDPIRPLRKKIEDLVPELSAGDNNTVRDLQHYVVGPSPDGLVLDAAGHLDPERSFRYVDNLGLLASQRVRNNPQSALSSKPIDFGAASLPDTDSGHAYWLYGDEDHQLVILTDSEGDIAVRPVAHLHQDQEGKVRWLDQSWAPGFPLHLFEDSELQLPPGSERGTWLSGWHTEREWMHAVHRCEYSNAVIGITEELSPVATNVPGPQGISSILRRFEARRRELVQADFHVFASDHWDFNSRFPNPGGNHGSFLRISTHSVWMLSGAGVPPEVVTEPYDSLNFASTVLSLTGHKPPMTDRVVTLRETVSGSGAHAEEVNERDTLKNPIAAGTRLVLRGDTKP